MGKAEVNPFAATSDSSSSSSSDSETEYATEAMERAPVCDEVVCLGGDDEPPIGASGGGESVEAGKACGRHRHHRGGRGCHKGRGRHHHHGRRHHERHHHPRMVMILMRSPPPPHVMMHTMHHGRHGLGGPCGPRFGPPRGGPWMRRRFLRHMMSNPEFWQRLGERFAEQGSQSEEVLSVEFSKMNVTDESGKENESDNAAEAKEGKKWHGKRRERWEIFMKHMFNEMNLHASTESEGDEGNHSDQCTEETIEKPEDAQDKKKEHFGGKFS